jgi:serine/threonine-protein kinase
MMLNLEPHKQEQPRVIGRYALYDEIASGGMATVHFGRLRGPLGFSRTVAVKRLHPQYARDPEFVAMFIDEARLAARIRHPNVVQTLDVVATEGELFLVMDYVQGESLSRLLRATRTVGPVPVRVASAIVCGALHGLHAAHEATDEHGQPLGLVHRDMSPQNVLVGIDGISRVLDFGVAVAAGRAQTTGQGKIKGKFGYMAPEQIQGRVSRQSDVFATGVVLWEVLTGRRLFPGDDPRQVLGNILSGEIVPPGRLASRLPAGIDKIVMRSLDRDTAKRYATAREMALDLEACLGLASPSQVGTWVESLAGSALSLRAAAIAEIESSSSTVVDVTELAQLESTPPESGVSPRLAASPLASGLSSNFGLGPPRPANDSIPVMFDPSRRRTRRVVVGLLCASAIAAGAGFLLIVQHASPMAAPVSSAAVAPASSPPLPPSSQSNLLPAPNPLAPTTVPVPIAASALAPRAAMTAAVPRSAPATPMGTHGAVPRPTPAPTARPTSEVDCDPPYSLDDQGHKHWKDECFRKQGP